MGNKLKFRRVMALFFALQIIVSMLPGGVFSIMASAQVYEDAVVSGLGDDSGSSVPEDVSVPEEQTDSSVPQPPESAPEGEEDIVTAASAVVLKPNHELEVAYHGAILFNLKDLVEETSYNNEALAYTVDTAPTNGVLENHFDGTVTFTHTVGRAGGTFAVKVSADGEDLGVCNVTVEMDLDSLPPDMPATANLKVDAKGAAVLDMTELNADTSITYSIGTNAVRGVAEIDAGNNALVKYTHTADTFEDNDSFTVCATGANGKACFVLIQVKVYDTPVAAAGPFRFFAPQGGATPYALAGVAESKFGYGITWSVEANGAKGNAAISGDGTKVLYTPNASSVGTDSFTLKAANTDKPENATTVIINVRVLNSASALEATIGGAPAVVDLEALCGADVVYSVKTGPTFGAAVITGGELTYTPSASNTTSQTDTFTLEVTENGISSDLVFNVKIYDLPSSPATQADSTDEEVPVTFTLEGLATSTLGYTLTWRNKTGSEYQPTFGTIEIAPDNKTVTYTPNNNEYGTDTFTLEVTNGKDQCLVFLLLKWPMCLICRWCKAKRWKPIPSPQSPSMCWITIPRWKPA